MLSLNLCQCDNQLDKMVVPSGVSTLSGWNCTPRTSYVLWRTAIICPSELSATASSTSGRLSRSITQEW